KLTMLAAGISFAAACHSAKPTTGAAGVSVNQVRARAENRLNQFFSRAGIGSIIYTNATVSSLGQSMSSTQFINFWRRGDNYRVEIRDASGGEPTVQVLNGATSRINFGSFGVTKDYSLDRLKNNNQRKLRYTLAGKVQFVDAGVPQL